MATDPASVGAIVAAVVSGFFTLVVATVALIPPARKAKQDDRQYALDERKAQDAEEMALRAELRATMTQLHTVMASEDTYRKRALEAEEALSKRKRECDSSGGYCQLTDAERAKIGTRGKPKSAEET